MPALGMAQETGTLIRWLKAEGERVVKDEPVMEIETDKVTVEIEAPAAGILSHVMAAEGDVVPVGQVVAIILAPGESEDSLTTSDNGATSDKASTHMGPKVAKTESSVEINASPVAARMIAEHHLNPGLVKPEGGMLKKRDIETYLAQQASSSPVSTLHAASPKARRLAAERGLDLADVYGSGPKGAVLAADLDKLEVKSTSQITPHTTPSAVASEMGNMWRVMAERTTLTWTTTPHFYLMREVVADRLQTWREAIPKQESVRITYTDLLIRLVALALRQHPRLNSQWTDDGIKENPEVNIGLAIGVDEGLVVPVIHNADTLNLVSIAVRRSELIALARAGKLRPTDMVGGTFTISNLGMYGIDAFNAVINSPQAAILAVGRIADRVVPVNGQPAVRPTMMLNLSGDHRVVDGARAAAFLNTLAAYIEEPLAAL